MENESAGENLMVLDIIDRKTHLHGQNKEINTEY